MDAQTACQLHDLRTRVKLMEDWRKRTLKNQHRDRVTTTATKRKRKGRNGTMKTQQKTLEVYKRPEGQWRCRVRAANGKIVAALRCRCCSRSISFSATCRRTCLSGTLSSCDSWDSCGLLGRGGKLDFSEGVRIRAGRSPSMSSLPLRFTGLLRVNGSTGVLA